MLAPVSGEPICQACAVTKKPTPIPVPKDGRASRAVLNDVMDCRIPKSDSSVRARARRILALPAITIPDDLALQRIEAAIRVTRNNLNLRVNLRKHESVADSYHFGGVGTRA